MDIKSVFNQILILFIIMLVGVLIRKLKAVGEQFGKVMIEFIMNVTLPALIITSMNYEFSKEIALNSSKVLLLCFISYIIFILIALLITKPLKVDKSSKNVYRFMLIFANVGFMGYPVVNAALGKEGVFYTAIYNIVFSILIWTVGIIIITNGNDKQKLNLKILLNPGTISTIIGLLIFLFSIKIPNIFFNTISTMGNMTTPLSMLYIGFTLAGGSIKDVFASSTMFILSFVRLIILPLVILFIILPFFKDKVILGVTVIMAAMPAAANTALFAGKFNSDTYTASKIVFITTLMSVITIPFIIYLFGIIIK